MKYNQFVIPNKNQINSVLNGRFSNLDFEVLKSAEYLIGIEDGLSFFLPDKRKLTSRLDYQCCNEILRFVTYDSEFNNLEFPIEEYSLSLKRDKSPSAFFQKFNLRYFHRDHPCCSEHLPYVKDDQIVPAVMLIMPKPPHKTIEYLNEVDYNKLERRLIYNIDLIDIMTDNVKNLNLVQESNFWDQQYFSQLQTN